MKCSWHTIVETVSLAGHGGHHAKLFLQITISTGAVLATAIRMVDEPCSRTLLLHRLEH